LAGLASALLAILIWGVQLPLAKSVMSQLDGFTLTFIRYGVAVILFAIFLWWKEGRKAFRWEDQTRTILIGGVVGMAGSALLVFLGLSMTKPELAVIILALQPGMTAVGHWLLFKRRPSYFTLFCLVLAFCGVVIAVTRGGESIQSLMGAGASVGQHAGAIFSTGNAQLDQLIGEILVLVGSLAWVTYVLASSKLTHWSALRIATLNCIPAVVVIGLAWAIAMACGFKRWPSLDIWTGWLGLKVAYVALLGVFLAMMLWNAGVQKIGPLNAMLLLNLMTVITFGFRALEGAHFDPAELLGAAIVVGALVANNIYQRLKSRPQ
jgi:drug/metabolite transporter (DMT)-like permease